MEITVTENVVWRSRVTDPPKPEQSEKDVGRSRFVVPPKPEQSEKKQSEKEQSEIWKNHRSTAVKWIKIAGVSVDWAHKLFSLGAAVSYVVETGAKQTLARVASKVGLRQ